MIYYSHHIGDYRRDTAHLSLLEHGVYRQLLDFYYLNEEPITLDHAKLMRSLCVRTAEEKEALANVLNDFFTKTENGYIQGKCDSVITKYHGKSAKAAESAKIRWANTDKGKHKSNAVDMRSHSEDNANQRTKEPNNQIRKTKTIAPPIGVDELVWNDFLALRKSKKAPVTATAIKGFEKEAAKAGMTLQQAIEHCCSKGWAGFDASWLKDKTSQFQTKQDQGNEAFHQLTGGMLKPKPKPNDAVFQSIGQTVDMESDHARLR